MRTTVLATLCVAAWTVAEADATTLLKRTHPTPAYNSKTMQEAHAQCYPAASRRLGEEGRVETELTIDEKGRVTAVSIVESSGSARLDEAAVCVATQLPFNPGTRNSVPVSSKGVLPVTFRIELETETVNKPDHEQCTAQQVRLGECQHERSGVSAHSQPENVQAAKQPPQRTRLPAAATRTATAPEPNQAAKRLAAQALDHWLSAGGHRLCQNFDIVNGRALLAAPYTNVPATARRNVLGYGRCLNGIASVADHVLAVIDVRRASAAGARPVESWEREVIAAHCGSAAQLVRENAGQMPAELAQSLYTTCSDAVIALAERFVPYAR